MKVVILAGNQPNQKGLCNQIAEVCEVSAVVLSRNIARKKPSFQGQMQLLANSAGNVLVGNSLKQAWLRILEEYERQFPEYPDVPLINVANVNDQETLDALDKYAPDLVVVSGTNLVGKRVIKKAEERLGITNLHTGLSPYVKGAPNCTNWCLATCAFHLIGNTVMWLDAGIDTGAIIATEQTQLDGTESLLDLHRKVLHHGNDLYVRVLKKLAAGERLPRVPQNSIAQGQTFYNKDWDVRAMRQALFNFRKYFADYFADAKNERRQTAGLKLFPLND